MQYKYKHYSQWGQHDMKFIKKIELHYTLIHIEISIIMVAFVFFWDYKLSLYYSIINNETEIYNFIFKYWFGSKEDTMKQNCHN